MSRIEVSDLTFGYEGSYDNVFEHISFSVNSEWKLGFLGRNGKGKTTLLNLLLGKYPYTGTIQSNEQFEYFPYIVPREAGKQDTIRVIELLCPGYELWKISKELDLLEVNQEILYRPYSTLSFGEQTKVMLSILFSEENRFLLIDEPTNHLDMQTRQIIKAYLAGKKGFILVSHDRDLLDACIDHVLVLNRNTIEVQKGNFSSWWENKQRQDAYELAENVRLKKEISRLTESAKRLQEWAEKGENAKIGFDPMKEHDRSKSARAYIGAKTKKMQKRNGCIEARRLQAADDKSTLLKDIEEPVDLKIMPLIHYKKDLITYRDCTLSYGEKVVLSGFSMYLRQGDRIVIQGNNGSGKSSIIKSILVNQNVERLGQGGDKSAEEAPTLTGENRIAKGLIVSYVSQDTSHLTGRLRDYIEANGEDESLFKALLNQLDFDKVQFDKNMEDYSEGQKKKVLVAGSLLRRAHLYIWDEPLNYIDVFSRIQIEALILKFCPTLLLIEHDISFAQKVATQVITL